MQMQLIHTGGKGLWGKGAGRKPQSLIVPAVPSWVALGNRESINPIRRGWVLGPRSGDERC